MRELQFRVYSYLDREFVYFDIYEGVPDIVGGYSIPQQYTGLKDLRKTKIFEGDIILHRRDNNKYKVVFDNQSASFKLLPVENVLVVDEQSSKFKIEKIIPILNNELSSRKIEEKTFDMLEINSIIIIANFIQE